MNKFTSPCPRNGKHRGVYIKKNILNSGWEGEWLLEKMKVYVRGNSKKEKGNKSGKLHHKHLKTHLSGV